MAPSFSEWVQIGTALGTLFAAGVAAWAVADARLARAHDARARLINAVYWPLAREVQSALANPTADLRRVLVEWSQIQDKHPDVALSVDRRIVEPIERIAALSPHGLYAEAAQVANSISLELARKNSPAFSPSAWAQFRIVLDGSPGDFIGAHEAWARRLQASSLAQSAADRHGCREWDLRIEGSNVMITGKALVESIYNNGSALFNTSPSGRAYAQYVHAASSELPSLDQLLKRKLRRR